MKHHAAGVALLVIGLFGAWPTRAQAPFEAALASGRADLEAGRYEEALEHFRRGRRQARDADDDAGEARLMFYQALSWQRQAQATPDDSRAMLRRAARLYRKVLAADRNAVSAAGNLARVYVQLGQNEEAEAAFRRAIAAADVRQAFYTESYADFLAAQGDWRRAAGLYRQVVLANPQSASAHRKLLDHGLHEDLAGLMKYLGELLAQGQVVRAQESAVLAMEMGSPSPGQLTALLELVVTSLSRQLYDPANFRIEVDPDRRLWEFRDDPIIGPGVRELFALHEGDGLVPNRFPWWTGNSGTGNSELSPTASALEAFRSLARSLGERHQRVDRSERAENLYRLAAHLEPYRIDPLALRDLADLYLAQGQRDAVERLATDYEPQLQTLMAASDQSGQLFDYRTSLGRMFVHLEAWGDPSTVPSALYQLEQGREVAALIDGFWLPQPRVAASASETQMLLFAMAKATGGEAQYLWRSPTFDEGLANLLAQGYEATGHLEDSYRVRLETAASYMVAGIPETAQQLLAPIEGSAIAGLDPHLDHAYTSLQSQLDRGTDIWRTGGMREPFDGGFRATSHSVLGLRNSPHTPSTRQDALDLAVALDNAGDTATAINHLKASFDEAGEANAYYYLGLAQIAAGESAKAKEHLQKFLELAPTHPEAATAREVLNQLE
ncbi:MAG: tetratricopeptide repeat protein [Acidobacteriota bacterium]